VQRCDRHCLQVERRVKSECCLEIVSRGRLCQLAPGTGAVSSALRGVIESWVSINLGQHSSPYYTNQALTKAAKKQLHSRSHACWLKVGFIYAEPALQKQISEEKP
jgi:hypothetical protein